jgi:hypothetical protein
MADALAPTRALIEEAMKRAAVAWLTVPDIRPYPVWCLWSDDALYLVSGAGEQPAPGLELTARRAGRVEVTARGDHGGAIVTWPARVELLDPDSAAWDQVAAPLAAKRLNSADPRTLAARWRQTGHVYRLSPT